MKVAGLVARRYTLEAIVGHQFDLVLRWHCHILGNDLIEVIFFIRCIILDLQYLLKINNLYCKKSWAAISYCTFEWVYQHVFKMVHLPTST